MTGKESRRKTPPARSRTTEAVPLCRYEELARRENRLREAAAKPEPRD